VIPDRVVHRAEPTVESGRARTEWLELPLGKVRYRVIGEGRPIVFVHGL
jgi:hypothetical protein